MAGIVDKFLNFMGSKFGRSTEREGEQKNGKIDGKSDCFSDGKTSEKKIDENAGKVNEGTNSLSTNKGQGTEETEVGCKGKAEIIRKDLELQKCWEGKLAFVLYNVFTKEECKKYIKDSEKRGYELALVNIGGGKQKKITDVRNSSRNIWDSVEEADKIYQRIKQHIPEYWKCRKFVDLNERLRFLRYDPGEYFKPHMDGLYERSNGDGSYITIQIYLNEGFEGGSTTFLSMNRNEEERVEVVPKTGSVLVFQQDILHEGSKLISGRKYTIRTEVMYSGKIEKHPEQKS